MTPEHSSIVWQSPWVGVACLVAGLALCAFGTVRMRQSRLPRVRIIVLTLCRVIPVLVLSTLLARPVQVRSRDEENARDVVLLIDRSASMALKDGGETTRYAAALAFAKTHLIPPIEQAGYKLKPVLFDATARPADAAALVSAIPDGPATDLGGAISTGLGTTSQKPLALVALTDGASNQSDSNRPAVASLLSARTPFIGVGFGTAQGAQTLNLLLLDAPDIAPPATAFRLSARIEAAVTGPLPPFDLILMRDGKFHSKRHIEGIDTSRYWSESFEITETEEGVHNFYVRIDSPAAPSLVIVNPEAKATVRVAREQEVRVLYMQGALTWDYKFIIRALNGDPSMHVTGLSRTSEHSVFRQNVESPGELLDGFPDNVRELAPFRVIVLAGLNPALLTAPQQEAIAKFCSEFGGGVLMIGGRDTFDSSWRGSRLEQLLPVQFDEDRGVTGLDQPFQLRLTAEALGDPVFEIAGPGKTRAAWEKLPAFDDYGRVADAKPGAVVWAVHSADAGPNGKPRILMAAQRYGAGTAAVITVQNFWKWRLAKESDQSHFDRFWRQFLRNLAQSNRQPIRIEVLDQALEPNRDILLSIEMPPSPEGDAPTTHRFRVLQNGSTELTSRDITLQPGRDEQVSFHPKSAGLYTIEITGSGNTSVASRVVEIRSPNVEMQTTARDMDTLEQWAAISSGSAWPVETARADPAAFAKALVAQIEAARISRMERIPLGIHAWTFLAILLPLCAGWILRKTWRMK